MAEVVRTIDTPRGPLLVTVQRVADRYATDGLTADDLIKAAGTLFWEAALMSKRVRWAEPEMTTGGVISE